jgi:hypothetical protein
MLALATKVLNDYSKMLAHIEPSNLGFSESFLPHSKTAIREATKSALLHLGAGQPSLREALIRGYVYLEQFVSDAQAEILMQAAMPAAPVDALLQDADIDVAALKANLHEGANAAGIVSAIKQRMDAALKEISQFGITS